MKTIILFFLSFAATSTFAQTPTIPEPEFEGQIIFVNTAKNKGTDLERQEAGLHKNGNAALYATGIGKVTKVATVHDAKSPVRIQKSPSIQFIYHAKTNTVNPADVIVLYSLTTKGDNRILEIASAGTFSGQTSGDMKTLQYTATKYGTSSYLITLTDFQPGEYGFSLGGPSYVLYLFGIDSN